ncbi:hypothetical protein [Devosia epidermidihirudinis]|uniref:hypothetical protein n=1 Tax=Devosia epidermidihirudinis TaxID=1293439 RepID=UPI000AB3895B|nr:hypothetical protein [Devosia epidermidihirudinis]
MNALNKLMGGTVLGLVLVAGLVAPSYADKLSGNQKNPPLAPSATTTAVGIDFGDDSSQWANDGECDDPRFSGAGSAEELRDEDTLRDATDCRAAYEAGTIAFVGTATEIIDDAPAAVPAAAAEIDFGDDSSEWAKDGECDDPRFSGSGAASDMLESDTGHDATDCKAAHAAGTVTFNGDSLPVAAAPISAKDIDFGDDSSEWANDGECDDPRFSGTGSAAELIDADIRKDATDCRAAFEAGTVSFTGASAVGDIDYGDDTSNWANDGECDDPRFSGTGVAPTLLEDDKGHDATDCREAVEAGTATYNGEDTEGVSTSSDPAVFDYGGDFSKWANDGECDDPRFYGAGTNKKLLSNDMYSDATDCKALVEAGTVSIRKVYTPEYAQGAPYDSTGIDFGDNSSDYAHDDQCDDPRFEGPGAASTLLDNDTLRDAADCKAAFEAGTITLVTE